MPTADPGPIAPKRNGRAWVLGALVCLLGLLALGFHATQLALTESLPVTRGSFAYYLLIPDVIRDLPLVESLGEPGFHSGAGDGPKPPSSSISYRSRAEEAVIRQAIETYLLDRGFEPFAEGTTFRRAGAGELSRPEITIWISESEDGTRQVMVMQID